MLKTIIYLSLSFAFALFSFSAIGVGGVDVDAAGFTPLGNNNDNYIDEEESSLNNPFNDYYTFHLETEKLPAGTDEVLFHIDTSVGLFEVGGIDSEVLLRDADMETVENYHFEDLYDSDDGGSDTFEPEGVILDGLHSDYEEPVRYLTFTVATELNEYDGYYLDQVSSNSYVELENVLDAHEVTIDYDSDRGSVDNVEDYYIVGDTVELNATSDAMYVFDGWQIDGAVDSLSKEYEFEMPDQDVSVYADFSKNFVDLQEVKLDNVYSNYYMFNVISHEIPDGVDSLYMHFYTTAGAFEEGNITSNIALKDADKQTIDTVDLDSVYDSDDGDNDAGSLEPEGFVLDGLTEEYGEQVKYVQFNVMTTLNDYEPTAIEETEDNTYMEIEDLYSSHSIVDKTQYRFDIEFENITNEDVTLNVPDTYDDIIVNQLDGETIPAGSTEELRVEDLIAGTSYHFQYYYEYQDYTSGHSSVSLELDPGTAYEIIDVDLESVEIDFQNKFPIQTDIYIDDYSNSVLYEELHGKSIGGNDVENIEIENLYSGFDYSFDYYLENGGLTSETRTVEFTTQGEWTVSIEYDSSLGYVEGDGVYANGQDVTIKATPNDDVVFKGWDIDGLPDSSDKEHTFEMPTEDVEIEALFSDNFIDENSVTIENIYDDYHMLFMQTHKLPDRTDILNLHAYTNAGVFEYANENSQVLLMDENEEIHDSIYLEDVYQTDEGDNDLGNFEPEGFILDDLREGYEEQIRYIKFNIITTLNDYEPTAIEETANNSYAYAEWTSYDILEVENRSFQIEIYSALPEEATLEILSYSDEKIKDQLDGESILSYGGRVFDITGLEPETVYEFEYRLYTEDNTSETFYAEVETGDYEYPQVRVLFEETRGSIKGEGGYPEGGTVELEAEPGYFYEFSHWVRDGEEVSDDLTYTFEMPDQHVNVRAVFVEDYWNSPQEVTSNFLERANLDSEWAETLLSVGFIVLGTVAMAKLNAPLPAMLVGIVVIMVLLMGIGLLPLWWALAIALGSIAAMVIVSKGGI